MNMRCLTLLLAVALCGGEENCRISELRFERNEKLSKTGNVSPIVVNTWPFTNAGQEAWDLLKVE